MIARDWKYNTELVNDDVGFNYETGDNAALTEAVDPATILKKEKSCLREAKKHTTSNAIEILMQQLDTEN